MLPSSRYLALNESHQRAQGGENRAIDFVILDHEPEPLLESGQDPHHRHGIEFRKHSQQPRLVGEFPGPSAQSQRPIKNAQRFLPYIDQLMPPERVSKIIRRRFARSGARRSGIEPARPALPGAKDR